MFRLGMALWGFDGWVGDFYPPGSPSEDFLELYVERMTAVEGNTFFYAVPDEQRVAGWADQMPERFRICPKLHREISHDPPLRGNKRRAAAFIRPMKAFGTHLGPFHLQLPPSYGPEHVEDLAGFLEAWPRRRGPIAVEVRHPGWFRPEPRAALRRLLARLGVARVLLDTRPIYEGPGDPEVYAERQKPELPADPHLTANFTMVRFISHPDRTQNRPYLERWAERIDRWIDCGVSVYFFVHCPAEVYSPRVARMFQEILEEREADVPPLPWSQLSDGSGQESLL